MGSVTKLRAKRKVFEPVKTHMDDTATIVTIIAYYEPVGKVSGVKTKLFAKKYFFSLIVVDS